ncbi:P-II family nitrogen regulator [Methanomassiliicoccus luminyensis]|jgi:nitrogen regulatory protein P-II 1|uniref:P-II family nitrogen regulator n=1 Tax=Methanomassiliicoccus luminyensis TaxID=1080712 RepID=UPI000378682D|nr:P-II family nitrogen regulator [Methanomassiliicoccus luminyensis]
MMKIDAIIRPEKTNQVKAALEEIDVIGITVHDVHGRGEQKGLEFINRAGKYRVDLLPKTLLTVVVPDPDVDKVIDTIVTAARTGEMGDGKIFVSPVERCVRIRTGEVDEKAV